MQKVEMFHISAGWASTMKIDRHLASNLRCLPDTLEDLRITHYGYFDHHLIDDVIKANGRNIQMLLLLQMVIDEG